MQTAPPVSTILPKTFPKGGNFPTLKASFSSVVAFSLRSEKDRIRKSEIFAKGGRAHWYALIDFEGSESLLILKGKPEQRVGEFFK